MPVTAVGATASPTVQGGVGLFVEEDIGGGQGFRSAPVLIAVAFARGRCPGKRRARGSRRRRAKARPMLARVARDLEAPPMARSMRIASEVRSAMESSSG